MSQRQHHLSVQVFGPLLISYILRNFVGNQKVLLMLISSAFYTLVTFSEKFLDWFCIFCIVYKPEEVESTPMRWFLSEKRTNLFQSVHPEFVYSKNAFLNTKSGHFIQSTNTATFFSNWCDPKNLFLISPFLFMIATLLPFSSSTFHWSWYCSSLYSSSSLVSFQYVIFLFIFITSTFPVTNFQLVNFRRH